MTVRVKAFLARGPVFGLLLCSPALLLMAFVLIFPLARSISLSFQRMNLVYPAANDPFVGLENYIRLFTLEPYFVQILGTTALFVIVTVLCGFTLGFVLALIPQSVATRTRVVLQTAFLLPYVLPSVALTLLWMWMFNPRYGVVNFVLKEFQLINEYKRWFVDPNLALVPLMAITVWKGGAFNMIILYAGLQNIPVELYEAASIDGGKALQNFRYITLPQLRHVITVLLLSAMYLLQFFTPIWILTRGGPGFSTTTLSIYIYRMAFERYDFGLASALGTLWFLFLAIATFIILRRSRRRD